MTYYSPEELAIGDRISLAPAYCKWYDENIGDAERELPYGFSTITELNMAEQYLLLDNGECIGFPDNPNNLPANAPAELPYHIYNAMFERG